MNKYFYIKDEDLVEDSFTHEKYIPGKIYNIPENGIDHDVYFRIYNAKNGMQKVRVYIYDKYRYKDKSICNKSALINRIRRCEKQKLKEIWDFFNVIEV